MQPETLSESICAHFVAIRHFVERICVQDERDRLRQKLTSVEDSRESATQQLSTCNARISALQEKSRELAEAKSDSEKVAGKLTKQVKELERRLDREGAERATVETRLVELKSRLAQVEADAEAVKADAENQVLLLFAA
jgi:chromosome segregation ATPase